MTTTKRWWSERPTNTEVNLVKCSIEKKMLMIIALIT